MLVIYYFIILSIWNKVNNFSSNESKENIKLNYTRNIPILLYSYQELVLGDLLPTNVFISDKLLRFKRSKPSTR